MVEIITEEGTNNKLETTTESLKLIKNTKSYNWEIKILSVDIGRLEKLNQTMMEKFGSITEQLA